METIWNEVNVDANFTTYTKFTQSYSEAHFILVSNSFLASVPVRVFLFLAHLDSELQMKTEVVY